MLTGPEAVQPGARNEYQVHTFAQGRLTSAKVAMRVLDEKKNTIYEQNVVSKGTVALALPSDMPVKPEQNLSLEVIAERSDGQKQEIHEELPLLARSMSRT